MKKSMMKLVGIVTLALIMSVMSITPALTASAETVRGRNTTDIKSGCKVVGVAGTFETADTTALLKRINEIRYEACTEGDVPDPRDTSRMLTASDYVPIKWSTELEKMAQLRAAEATVVWGHNRPNGDSTPWSAAYGQSSCGENISGGTMAKSIQSYYAEKAKYIEVKAFQNNTGHYWNMIDPGNTYVGLGSFTNAKDSVKRAAMEMGFGSGWSEAATGEYGAMTQEIEMTEALAAKYETTEPEDPGTQPDQGNTLRPEVSIYRLYNPKTKEHLYTPSKNEYTVLGKRGWRQEGIGWYTAKSGKAVYRLYNPARKSHLYTSDTNEVKVLTTKYGWKKDNNGKPLFMTAGKVPIYRLYNLKLKQHHYTTSKNEYKTLKSYGWNQEGVAMNGVK